MCAVYNNQMNKQNKITFDISKPDSQLIPFVFTSPHSGTNYSPSFIAKSKLDPLTLRCSEDSFIDDLFSEAPNYGAPLLKALFPRAYVDPNRETYELDQKMFEEPLPHFVNTKSPRVFAGFGTVPRVVKNGKNIYRDKITFKEVTKRIESCYIPYHAALRFLIDETKLKFGKCILIDCHSMPSSGHSIAGKADNQQVDVVLGNKYGKTCAFELMQFVDSHLKSLNLVVRQNYPYAGGYTTQHYGNPGRSIHTLQIEVNRAIYMNEETITRNENYTALKKKLSNLLNALAEAKFNF